MPTFQLPASLNLGAPGFDQGFLSRLGNIQGFQFQGGPSGPLPPAPRPGPSPNPVPPPGSAPGPFGEPPIPAPQVPQQPAPLPPQPPPNTLPQNNLADGRRYRDFTNWWLQNFGSTPPPTREQWQSGNFVLPNTGGGQQPGGGPGGTPVDLPQGQNPNVRPDNDPLRFLDQIAPIAALLGLNIQPDTVGVQEGSRGNLLNLLSGLVFQNDPLELPGDNQALGFGLNLALSRALEQGQESGQVRDILANLIPFLGDSQASQVNQQNLGAAGELTRPGALDELTAQRRDDLRSTVAQGQQSAEQRLRDLGLLGRGAASRDVVAQLQNLGTEQTRRGLLDISEQEERDRLSRLSGATQATAAGTDVFRALSRDPVLQLADFLQREGNPAAQILADRLIQANNLAVGEAIASRNPTVFESVSPLLGSAIGAIGGLASRPRRDDREA